MASQIASTSPFDDGLAACCAPSRGSKGRAGREGRTWRCWTCPPCRCWAVEAAEAAEGPRSHRSSSETAVDPNEEAEVRTRKTRPQTPVRGRTSPNACRRMRGNDRKGAGPIDLRSGTERYETDAAWHVESAEARTFEAKDQDGKTRITFRSEASAQPLRTRQTARHGRERDPAWQPQTPPVHSQLSIHGKCKGTAQVPKANGPGPDDRTGCRRGRKNDRDLAAMEGKDQRERRWFADSSVLLFPSRNENGKNAGQVVCGIAIAVSANALLYQFMKTSGMILGALMVLIGLLGVVGSAMKHRPVLNLYLVGALFGVMLTFQYIGELGREVTVDCALAELDIRTINLASAMKKSKDKELFASIYSRMDEMEQMMSMVHAGAVESLAIKSPDDKLKMTDAKYIRKKLDMLHRIAAEIESDPIPYEVIAHVVEAKKGDEKTGEETESSGEDEGGKGKEVLRLRERQRYVKLLSTEDKQFIEKRLKAAEEVLDFIDDHDDGDGDVELTTESYRELLNILAGAFNHPKLEKKNEDILDDLSISVKEVPNMHGAIQRAKSDSYGKDKVEKYLEEMHELEKLREQKKKKWTEEFKQKLMHSNRNRAKLNQGLDDMPQHCIEDEKAMSIISKAGYALVSFLLFCAFIVLNLLFQIPPKGD